MSARRSPTKAKRALAASGACAAIGALAIAAAGPGGAAAEPVAQAAAPVKVSMGDNFFNPVKAKVPAGGKVKWTNAGKVDHNVKFPGGFKSGNIAPGQGVVRKFGKAGKFPYSCTLHPGMNGTVKVLAAQ